MKSTGSPRVIIVGAGLGGLMAAAAFHQAGIDAVVLEQAKQLGEVGAGLHVSPNAIQIFRALGLERSLVEFACEPKAFSGFDWKSGRRLFSTPIGDFFRSTYGTGYYTVYRPELHALLRTAVPANALLTDSRVVEVGQDAKSAFAKLANGTTISGDILIGADGIHSVVRSAVGATDRPHFTGMIAFRGVVPADSIPPGLIENEAASWMGPHGHIVHYYISSGKLLNIVAIHENEHWKDESWSMPATHDEVLETFARWHPTIRTLLGSTTRPFKWALYDRDPIGQWSSGRITILGDSAHAMLPFMAQGAAMAFEDAWVIAKCVVRNPTNVVEALHEYEDERRSRTARVLLASRARSSSLHEPSTWRRATRNAGFALKNWWDPQRTMHQAEWVYRYNCTAYQHRGISSRVS